MVASALLRCQLAREAISALVDGEDPPVSEMIISAHLAQCPRCRQFRTGVVSLRRQVCVRVFAPTASSPGEILELLGYSDAAPVDSRGRARRWAQTHRFSWVRATQWAAGVVPLGVALPALALGAFAHIHIVPSHVPSPCTMSLHHARHG
jgi:RNA polymerase sigma-70 factor (ECF subfamily)